MKSPHYALIILLIFVYSCRNYQQGICPDVDRVYEGNRDHRIPGWVKRAVQKNIKEDPYYVHSIVIPKPELAGEGLTLPRLGTRIDELVQSMQDSTVLKRDTLKGPLAEIEERIKAGEEVSPRELKKAVRQERKYRKTHPVVQSEDASSIEDEWHKETRLLGLISFVIAMLAFGVLFFNFLIGLLMLIAAFIVAMISLGRYKKLEDKTGRIFPLITSFFVPVVLLSLIILIVVAIALLLEGLSPFIS